MAFGMAAALWGLGLANTASAQVQRSFINLGFEQPVFGGGCSWAIIPSANVPGWETTHPVAAGNCGYGSGQLIELWKSGYNGVPSRAGGQHAELNASQASRIYQSVCVLPNDEIGWQFSHTGYDNSGLFRTDVMEFKLGAAGNRVVRAGTTTAGGGGVTTCYNEGGVSGNTCTSSRSGRWRDYSGSFTWSGAASVQQFGFEAISSAGPANGNHIDQIQLTILPLVELTGPSSGPESEPSADLPQLLVSGNLPAPLDVAVNITGGTAVLGSDFSTPGGASPFTMTIPAGNYAGEAFPLGVQIVKDSVSEPDETIEFEIVENTAAYVLSSTQSCGAAAIATTTYTVLDEVIALEKAGTLDDGGDGRADAGDVIDYAFTVANTGSVDLTNVTVTDATAGVTVSGGPISLAAGASDSASFTATYTLTQADIDAGSFQNQAEVSGAVAATGFIVTDLSDDPADATDTDTNGNGNPDDPTVVPLAAAGSQALEKASTLNDANGNGRPDAGEAIDYVFTVTNTGNVSLIDIVITDDKATVSGSPIAGPLAPGASDGSATGVYTLTQADIDAGQVENSAEATGQDPQGNSVTAQSAPPGGNPGDPTVTAMAQEGESDFVKEANHNDANGNGQVDVGEVIDYSFTVENTGNVSLTDIVVTDSKATVTGSPIPGPLAPGAVDATSVTGTYTVTQADVDSGGVDNVAELTAKDPNGNNVTATSRPPNGAPGAPTSFPIAGDPRLSVEKTGTFIVPDDDANGNGVPDAGESVRYAFTVTNTGNVSLADIALSDPDAAVSGGPIASLASGESDTTTFTASHVLTQADVDAGQVLNQATATGTPPAGAPVTDLSDDPADPTDNDANGNGNPDDPTVLTLTQSGSSDLVKESALNDANGNGFPDVGETIDYAFTVTNTGNVTLTDIVITDDKATVSGSPIASLAPGEVDSTSVTGVYTITQGDIDAGTLENTADLTAKDPNGDDVTVRSRPPGGNPGDSTPTEFAQNPALAVEKTAALVDADGNGFADAGETVEYSFKVANTGNVTLSNITLSDPLVAVSGGPLILAPGDEDTAGFTGTYVLTQADVDAGEVVNQASATGMSAKGDTATDLSDDPADPTDNDANGNGNPDDPTVYPLPQNARVLLHETGGLIDANGNGRADAGEIIRFAFQLFNTGSVTLSNLVVDDPTDDDVEGGPLAFLAPGATDTATFTEDHVITQAEIDAGRLERHSEVHADTPKGVTISVLSDDPTDPTDEDKDGDGNPDDPTVFTFEQVPAIELELTGSVVDADGDGFPDAGEAVAYVFTVRNTGNVTLSNITIPSFDVELKEAAPASAAAIRPLALVPVGGTLASLAPGEEDAATFASSYPLTQAELDAGRIDATATTAASAPDGDPVSDISDDPADATEADPEGDGEPDDPTVLLLPQNAVLALEKSGIVDDADGNGFADPGEGLLYSFTVENTGNVTVDDVTPSDPGPRFDGHAPAGSLSSFDPGPVRLAPGEAQVFTATYSLAAADLDHVLGVEEGVVNEAAAAGRSARDGGEVVSPPASAVITLPGFAITKTARQKQVMRGGRVPYTITVRSLTDGAATGTVVDQMPAGFAFLEGSASVDGVAAAPEVEGQFLTFKDLTIASDADTVIELSLVASASAKPGKYVNRARVLAPNGRPLTRDATATVEVVVEPVFDCGDVIGKVFDDANRNGYQDDGERGLAGVRVATVNGLLIATDRHGRFHVACADLPDQRIGSTFLMKLDTRTLPTGYRLTSENPRAVRLTAGKASRLNFAAAIGRVVRLDLTAEAFEPGATALRPEWEAGLDRLIAVLATEPATLSLAYIDPDTDRRTAAKRTRAVRKLIQHRWKQSAPKYTLTIETRVQTKSPARTRMPTDQTLPVYK